MPSLSVSSNQSSDPEAMLLLMSKKFSESQNFSQMDTVVNGESSTLSGGNPPCADNSICGSESDDLVRVTASD